ncbi:membrane protein [Clostridia bacterium]|nr:membrane protein [Clostridia bacterium]
MTFIKDTIAGLSLFSWRDGIDILIMAFLIYWLMRLVSASNSMRLLRGIIVLFVVLWLSEFFNFVMLKFILSSLVQVGLLALVVVFQPELRKLLEQFGSSSNIKKLIGREMVGAWENAILQTVECCRELAWARVGALIVFERRVKLDDYIKTGTIVNSDIAAELMKNIFYPKAPLHDGAAIIQDARIAGAGCMLPLTNNQNLSRDLGMRHRAGIGMSENSDAVVVIVSEETGSISVAVGGMLKRHLTPETLEKLLRTELIPDDESQKKQGFIAKLLARFRGNRDED